MNLQISMAVSHGCRMIFTLSIWEPGNSQVFAGALCCWVISLLEGQLSVKWIHAWIWIWTRVLILSPDTSPLSHTIFSLSLSLSMYVSLSICMFVSLALSFRPLPISLSLSPCVSHRVSMCMFRCPSSPLSLHSFPLSLSLCMCHCLFVYAWMYDFQSTLENINIAPLPVAAKLQTRNVTTASKLHFCFPNIHFTDKTLDKNRRCNYAFCSIVVRPRQFFNPCVHVLSSQLGKAGIG